jgi:hypothetical protein
MAVPPGAAEMTQQTSIHNKQSFFLSKILSVTWNSLIKFYCFVYYRFFRKSQKPKKPQVRRLKAFEIYKFADKLDIFLMIIGTMAG